MARLVVVVVVLAGAGRGQEEEEGTYNPKSAWMMVDSRRRVLPDIDGEQGQGQEQEQGKEVGAG